jgi:SAM-dependent methyltransferase
VVEAGSGWGGLARYLVRHYDVNVRSYNISAEQVAYARERARREGLDDRIEYVQDDYRNATGSYDVFVSVGMLEHVGVDNYPVLGSTIDRCLKDDGRGLDSLHRAGFPRPLNEWIESYIFPGAYPPTLREMMDIFEPSGFLWPMWKTCVPTTRRPCGTGWSASKPTAPGWPRCSTMISCAPGAFTWRVRGRLHRGPAAALSGAVPPARLPQPAGDPRPHAGGAVNAASGRHHRRRRPGRFFRSLGADT